MKRRTVLAVFVGAAGASMTGCATARPAIRVRPGDVRWPDDASWTDLKRAVGGRLEPVALPHAGPGEARQLFNNPFWLGDQPGLTQMSGWVDAWASAPSTYAVRARTAEDVAAAVHFASTHGVRLVVKGGGHSYFGGSCAPDSLLIWTRDMETIEMHDAFVPLGSSAAPTHAVSVGAGCLWGRVYDAVTTRGGRYVQGGGCTTVGVAGLVQGGGFGSFSKGFGIAAASLLEVEIITADGRVRIVNEARDKDLFWALKGGGGGTFGVVTRLTLRTHDLPEILGAARFTVKAKSEGAFRRLLARFIEHYSENLFNPRWGEQARAMSDNRLICEMVFQGLSAAEARAAWAGFETFVKSAPEDFQILQPLLIVAIPAQRFWDGEFMGTAAPGAIATDPRPGARPRDFWWSGDGAQASATCLGYMSAWMPASLLLSDNRAGLSDAWFEASRKWTTSFHFNKGLAGSAPEALAASHNTSMNPQVLDAFALVIIAAEGPSIYPQFPPPDLERARQARPRIAEAMQAMRRVAPNAGNYLSECDYFNENWRKDSWGAHWEELSRVKRRYDPDGLFIVHHGVGSERWSADGFNPKAD